MIQDTQHEFNIRTQLDAARAAAPDDGTFYDVISRWVEEHGVEIENDDGIPVRLVGDGREGARVVISAALNTFRSLQRELED